MRMFLRPRWLVIHATFAAVAVLFVTLGLWQLSRLAERRAENQLMTQNLQAPASSLDEAFARYGHDPDALAYRPVTARGTYRPEEEVLLTPRANGRRAGHHVLTPLELPDGRAVLVDRGWVPYEHDTPPVAAAAPPPGEVQVTGILVPTQEAVRYGSAGGETDELTFLSAVDVDRLQPQLELDVYPVGILLQEQQPSPASLPLPGLLPDISEGSHQSYAWQWFAFATIVVGGYPLLLRRSLRAARQRQDVA